MQRDGIGRLTYESPSTVQTTGATSMPIYLSELLDRILREIEVRVKRVVDQTRAILQESLRAECRLSLRTKEETDKNKHGAQVPIEISPGCPAKIINMEFPGLITHQQKLSAEPCLKCEDGKRFSSRIK